MALGALQELQKEAERRLISDLTKLPPAVALAELRVAYRGWLLARAEPLDVLGAVARYLKALELD